MEDLCNLIHIKHFINPHLFWFERLEIDEYFKRQKLQFVEDRVKEQVELKERKNSNAAQDYNRHHFVVGDSVAVHYAPWKRYVRGNILHRLNSSSQNEEILVWLTDYGIPVLVHLHDLLPLAKELESIGSNIQCGGVANILPAELEYDFEEGSLLLNRKTHWFRKACVMVRQLLDGALQVRFIVKFTGQTTPGGGRPSKELSFEHNWGDLIVTNKQNNTFNIQQFLKSAQYAVIVPELEFVDKCKQQSLETTGIPLWLDNERNMCLNVNTTLPQQTYSKYGKLENIGRKSEANKMGNKNNQFNVVNDGQRWTSRRNTRGEHSTIVDDDDDDDDEATSSTLNRQMKSRDFDDFVHQMNYIGMAGALIKPDLAKIRRLQCPSDEDFQMSPMKLTKEDRSMSLLPEDFDPAECLNKMSPHLRSEMAILNRFDSLEHKNKTMHQLEREKEDSENPVQSTDDKFHENLEKDEKKLKEVINGQCKIAETIPPMNCGESTIANNNNTYENINILPAGFDVSRLQKYRHPEQHWHCKKTTRYDSTPNWKSKMEEKDSNDTQSQTSRSMIRLKKQAIISSAEEIDQNKSITIRNPMKTVIESDEKINGEKLTNQSVSSSSSHNIINIRHENALKTHFIQHLTLTHSRCTLNGIENIKEVDFIPQIHERLQKLGINKVFRIQVFAWSHIIQGNSFFVVSPRKSGKTWSYLPAICHQFYQEAKTTTNPLSIIEKCYGPASIIIVPSAIDVEEIFMICTNLLSIDINFKIVTTFGIRDLTETKIHLLNGCDLLICTVCSLHRLLKLNKEENLINGGRLKRIIVDNMHEMMARCHLEFYSVLNDLIGMCDRVVQKGGDGGQCFRPQFIVTSKDWNEILTRLMAATWNPLLVMGDFLEAAVYAQTSISVKLCSKANKDQELIAFLQRLLLSTIAGRRTLIVCNDDDQVQHLAKVLWQNGFPTIPYSNNATEMDRRMVKEWQHQEIARSVVICADEHLAELQIQRAHILIQYNLPKSWTMFNRRYSTLIENYPVFNEKREEHQHSLSVILLDEEDNIKLPRIMDFMQKHRQQVDPRLLAVDKHIRLEIEKRRQKGGVPFCEQVMEFGECDIRECDRHHFLYKRDVENRYDLPVNGDIRIYVLKVFSPTFYMARILQHKPFGNNNNNDKKESQREEGGNRELWKTIRRSDEFFSFSITLNLYYDDETNLIGHWPPILNDVCIYRFQERYQRARIIKEPTIDYNLNVLRSNLPIKLQLLDLGEIIEEANCSEIFKCAQQFLQFPIQAIGIRLANLMPFDYERQWDSKSTQMVSKWIKDDVQRNNGREYVVQANNIHSVACDTIWVNNVLVLERLKALQTYAQVVNVQRSLISMNFAMLNKWTKSKITEVRSSEEKEEEEKKVDNTHTNKSEKEQSKGIEIEKEEEEEEEKESPEEKERSSSSCSQIEDKSLIMTNDDVSNCHDSPPPLEESWCRIPKNHLIPVELYDQSSYGDWENSFVQLKDTESRQWFNALTEKINEHIAQLRNVSPDPSSTGCDREIDLEQFYPLANFIIRHDGYYFRAKLCGIFGQRVHERIFRFFLCDGATTVYVKERDLFLDCCYPTTPEIVHFTPYQTIHCQLAGIKWSPQHKEDRYPLQKKYCYIYAVMDESEMSKVSTVSSSNVKQQMKMNSYSVLFFECDDEYLDVNETDEHWKQQQPLSMEMINRNLIEHCKMSPDPSTEHFLSMDLETIQGLTSPTTGSDKDKDTENGKDKEIETFANLIKCLQESDAKDVLNFFASCFQNPTTEKEEEEEEDQGLKITEIVDEEEIKEQKVVNVSTIPEKEAREEEEENDKKEENCTTVPILKVLNRPLKTTWFETDWMLMFSVHAPDAKEYNIRVRNQVFLFWARICDEYHAFVLNFLGNVCPERTTHEVRGTNVIVRLVKRSFGIWPRLLNDSNTNYSWLTYDFNVMDCDERIMMERFLPTAGHFTFKDPSEQDDESNVDESNSDTDHDDDERYT